MDSPSFLQSPNRRATIMLIVLKKRFLGSHAGLARGNGFFQGVRDNALICGVRRNYRIKLDIVLGSNCVSASVWMTRCRSPGSGKPIANSHWQVRLRV